MNLFFLLLAWPIGFNLQDKRMYYSDSQGASQLESTIYGNSQENMDRYRACMWCMRNAHLGCDPLSYCRLPGTGHK